VLFGCGQGGVCGVQGLRDDVPGRLGPPGLPLVQYAIGLGPPLPRVHRVVHRVLGAGDELVHAGPGADLDRRGPALWSPFESRPGRIRAVRRDVVAVFVRDHRFCREIRAWILGRCVEEAVIVVPTIGRDAREICARLGDFSLKAGPACETAAAVRAVTTTAAHRTRRRAEGERPARLELRERTVAWGSRSREAILTT